MQNSSESPMDVRANKGIKSVGVEQTNIIWGRAESVEQTEFSRVRTT